MADLGAVPSKKLGLLIHPKGSFELATVTSAGCVEPRSVDTVATLPDGEAFSYSPDGSKLAIATASSVLVFSGEGGAPLVSLPLPSVAALLFSPDGSLLLTWHKKSGEEPNLLVHDVASGERRVGFHQRAWVPDGSAFAWSSDGKVAVKLFPDSVQLFDGAFPLAAGGTGAPPVPLGRIPVDGVKAVWLSPGGPPYTLLTFTPRTKSKPGSVCLWPFPGAPVPLAAKSLQADEARAVFCPDGSGVLVEMSTSSSADNYYGDSRLFLFDRSGKVAAPVPGLKEGPTHDFVWSPRSDAFVVVSGKSPPLATLHAGRTGAPTFSFGTAAFNTARFSPHGRFLMLGGFGNMPGDMTLWDVNKRKPLGPTFNAPCTVDVAWSPDGRYVLTTTTRPRLNVDNGYKVFSHRGVLVAAARHEQLFHAAWRPAHAAAFEDRPASPEPPADRVAAAVAAAGASSSATASGGAAGSGAAATPVTSPTSPSSSSGGVAAKGAYVPPHLRKSGGINVVAEMMRADHKTAGAIKPSAPTASAAKDLGLPVGAAPVELSKAAKKRLKEKEKKAADKEREEAEAALQQAAAAAAAASAVAAASASAAAAEPEDPVKLKRRIEKKLRQVAELEESARNGAVLNEDQQAKVAAAEELRRQLEAIQI